MLMILSPAKTFKEECESFLVPSDARLFLKKTNLLIEELKQYSEEELMDLMKISSSIAKVNQERFATFDLDTNGYQALYAFEGEAYKGLDASHLSLEAMQFSCESLRILSGLYGVLRPNDLMKPYRLEMGLKWTGIHGKNLYDFWREELTDYFIEELSQTPGDQALINLSSKEYSKVLDMKRIIQQFQVITIEFKEKKEDKYKVVGMYAKRARGEMARYILEHQIHHVEQLKQFKEGGYCFNDVLSTEKTWIFTRE